MRNIILFFLSSVSLSIINAQNVDYESRITRFTANCNEAFGSEYTWNGWLRDNTTTVETFSGCIQENGSNTITRTGSFAIRNRFNISATQIVSRLDGWEDDNGSRCSWQTGDDCRVRRSASYNFLNPLEYQWTTSTTNYLGTNESNLNTYFRYRYATTTLGQATEYNATTLTTAGNRPFWGARGNWANADSDCATSGTIGDSQVSSFSTTVTCQRQVSFRWRVSSQFASDYLEVWVNGVRRSRISGNRGWQLNTLNLDFGSNTVEWRYVKDAAGSAGLDRGFIDNISFTPATTMNGGSINGNQTLSCDGNPSTMSSATNAQSYSTTINYQWQSSTNNTTWVNVSGATSLSYNPPSGLRTTTYYRRRAIDGCGLISYSNTVTKAVTREFIYDGTWCPNDPSDSVNLSNVTDDVYIRSNLNQFNGFVAGNLTIDNGVTMNITSATGIQVANNLILNGVLNLNGEGQLVQAPGSVVTNGAQGKIQVTRYGNPSLYRYTYWSSPVSTYSTLSNSGYSIFNVMKDGTTSVPRTMSFTSQSVRNGAPGTVSTAATISGRWLYAFRDLASTYANWEFINPTDMLQTAQGFTMKGTGTTSLSQAYIFEGTPNNGNISLSMAPDNDYLIGNPYPSAIDTHQFLINNPHLDGTLYFWEHYGGNSHYLADYQGGYALYNLSGGVGAPSLATPANGVSTQGTATKLPARYVAVGQGFFVKSVTAGNLSFSNDIRVYAQEVNGTSIFIKSAIANKSNTSPQVDMRTKLRIGMNSSQMGHRQLLLTEDVNTTWSVDKYYDGEILDNYNDDFAFDLNQKNYGIQGVPLVDNTTGIPLVVDVSNAGDFEFMIDALENWNNGLSIYLYDAQTSIYHDITNTSTTINLTAGQYKNRFAIKFEDLTLGNIDQNLNNNYAVFQQSNENNIIVKAVSDNVSLSQFLIYDLKGKLIYDKPAVHLNNEVSTWKIDASQWTSGVYIISLIGNKYKVSQRFIFDKK